MAGEITKTKTIKIYGKSEDEVRQSLGDIIKSDIPSVKIIPFDAEVHVVLSASADTEEDARKIIKPVSKNIKKIFGDAIYSVKEHETIEMAVVRLLEKNDLTVTTAESLTGGLIAATLVNVAGVSDVFREGFITYSNKAKRRTLDVSKNTLKKYGAVSKQTAKEMATGAAFATDADISIAVTGIAGPDGGSEEKPIGLVYIGCYYKDKVTVEEYRFDGDRQSIREQTVRSALDLLRRTILANFH